MESGAKGGMESRTNGRAHLEKALVCRAPNAASVSYDSQWLINFCQMSFMEGTINGWQRSCCRYRMELKARSSSADNKPSDEF